MISKKMGKKVNTHQSAVICEREDGAYGVIRRTAVR